jgi:hypothetical protein
MVRLSVQGGCSGVGLERPAHGLDRLAGGRGGAGMRGAGGGAADKEDPKALSSSTVFFPRPP